MGMGLSSIDFRHSLPRKPQTNGGVERANQTIKRMLESSQQWDQELECVTRSYN